MNLKEISIASVFGFFILISCNDSRTQQSDLAQKDVSETLKDESGYDFVSKREYGDLVNNLYKEILSKNAELKDLETKLEILENSKQDSLNQYNSYNAKNESYYQNVDEHLKSINDSILRNKIRRLISCSLAKYNSNTAQFSKLLKTIDTKTRTLEDLHEVLIITSTLPIIEKYQNENLPSTKSIASFNNQLDNAIAIERKLVNKTVVSEK